jgi:glycosyltransferase involved in cell wall biosynthesis
VANAVLSLLLAGVLLAWLRFAWVLRGVGALPNLARESADPPAGGWPKLSVVVACRNEEAHVRAALASLLAQDYPALEIVAIDDRSEDRTGAVLDGLAAGDPRLRVLHVTSLPAGWLGKTHALQRGAEQAAGDFLLFTDADVVFAPDALRRAVAWAVRDGLGHAVALPQFVAPGFAERSFVSLFGMLLLIDLRVDEIGRRDGGRGHIGVGAFNLVRRDAYDAVGGHTRLRMEVVDDIKLGLILRRAGVAQGAADSGGTVRVRWQSGFFASMTGLVKNFFAGCDYLWRNVFRSAVLLPFATVFPLVCLFAAPTPLARVLAAAALAVPVVVLGRAARRIAGGRGTEGLLLPIVGPCLAAVALTSAIVTTARGAVVWRSTRYDLRELRANCVRDDQ